MDGSDSRKKERSPVFPFIPLARAIERATEFYREEKRGAAPYGRAVMHWKYSPSSSGGLQTASALKTYGLMEDVGGSGSERQLKLTDLALRIILDQRPESTERDKYIKEAALSPSISREIFERWPDDLPSDSTLNHYLVLERKFNETTAVSVVKILKQNQQLTRSTDFDVQSSWEDSISEKQMPPVAAPTPPQAADLPRNSASKSVAMVTASAPEAQLVLRNSGVTISIHFSEEPSREVFEYLERYCGFEKGNVPTKAEMRSVNSAGNEQPAE